MIWVAAGAGASDFPQPAAARPLTDVQRRVLGHIPVWRDESVRESVIEHEVASGHRSIQSYTTTELLARLATDRGLRAEDNKPGVFERTLDELEGAGFAVDGDEGWTMTEAGFDALHDDSAIYKPPFEFARIAAGVVLAGKLKSAGILPGTSEFNLAGGLDRPTVQAWADAHGAGVPDLDDLIAAAPERPEPEPEEVPATVPGFSGAPPIVGGG